MKISKITVAICLIAAMVASSQWTACASDGKDTQTKDERSRAKHEEFFKELGLSAEQQKTLQENKKKNREEIKNSFRAMKEKRGLLRQELQKETLDMVKVNALNEDLKKLQSQMTDQRLASILEVRKVLTPEQFKKFMKKTERHMGRAGKSKGPQDGPENSEM